MQTAPTQEMPIVALILLGVLGICLIIGFILWIVSMVKAFKAGDTLWGILTLLFGIPGLIWLFMNGQKKLGITWGLVAIIAGGCAGASFATLITLLPDAVPVPA